MEGEKPTRNELERLYWKEQHSLSEMGRKYDVNSSTVSRWMKSNGIEVRDTCEAKSVHIPTRKELENLYNSGMFIYQIAEHYEVSDGTIVNWLKKRKISKRSRKQSAVLRDDVRWAGLEEWEEFGIKSGFNSRSPSSLRNSRNKTEIGWYVKGKDNKWLGQFDLQRIRQNNKWKTEKEWAKWGLDRNYNLKNPNSVIKSKNKDDRRWYNCGQKSGWLNSFSFERKQVEGRWESAEEWVQYGLERNYSQRTPASLQRSNKEEDRDWYNLGQRKKWLRQFNFPGSRCRLSTEKLARLTRKELSKMYAEEGLSVEEIAETLKVSEQSVLLRLNKFGIRKSKKLERNVKNGMWRNLEFTLEQAKIFLEEYPEYEELPPMGVVSRTVGYSSLAASIIKYHGGFPVFRQMINEYLGRQSEDESRSLLEAYIGGNNND